MYKDINMLSRKISIEGYKYIIKKSKYYHFMRGV